MPKLIAYIEDEGVRWKKVPEDLHVTSIEIRHRPPDVFEHPQQEGRTSKLMASHPSIPFQFFALGFEDNLIWDAFLQQKGSNGGWHDFAFIIPEPSETAS